jgi:hypothetical protein
MRKFCNKETSAVFMADLLYTQSAVAIQTDFNAETQVKRNILTEEESRTDSSSNTGVTLFAISWCNWRFCSYCARWCPLIGDTEMEYLSVYVFWAEEKILEQGRKIASTCI